MEDQQRELTQAHRADPRTHDKELGWRPERSPTEERDAQLARPRRREDDTQPVTYAGRLRSCEWCGSLHPADLAEAITKGARGHWADRKYGWPHKFYVKGIPNPHAGQPEVRSSGFLGDVTPEERAQRGGTWTARSTGGWCWAEDPRPAPETTHGKFYSVHLLDATPEQRKIIERAMGLNFDFEGERVAWWRFDEARPPEARPSEAKG